MRSSRIKVSEKESRICFGVMRDTPPCVRFRKTQPGFGARLTGEEGGQYTGRPVHSQGNSLSNSRGLEPTTVEPWHRPWTGTLSSRQCPRVPVRLSAQDE